MSPFILIYILIYNRLETAKELFNLRYASLRNAIERIFRVVKRKFKILTTIREYSLDVQRDIVTAITGLYNFIRTYEGEGQEDDITRGQEDSEETTTVAQTAQVVSRSGNKAMNKFRDKLAKEI